MVSTGANRRTARQFLDSDSVSPEFSTASSCRARHHVGGRLLFHKSKGSASFHPVEGVDDLIPIEDGEELFQRVHWVARTRRNEFSEDAPGILDGP